MDLKIGDKLYLRPDMVEKISPDNPWSFFYGIKMSKEDILNHEFEVIHLRQKDPFGIQRTNDICIKWLDGNDWWWGQVGQSEPWTTLFIDEKQYSRNKKISEIVKD